MYDRSSSVLARSPRVDFLCFPMVKRKSLPGQKSDRTTRRLSGPAFISAALLASVLTFVIALAVPTSIWKS